MSPAPTLTPFGFTPDVAELTSLGGIVREIERLKLAKTAVYSAMRQRTTGRRRPFDNEIARLNMLEAEFRQLRHRLSRENAPLFLHAFMSVVKHAVSREQYDAWVAAAHAVQQSSPVRNGGSFRSRP